MAAMLQAGAYLERPREAPVPFPLSVPSVLRSRSTLVAVPLAGMRRPRSIAIFRPELRPATMTGAQARGAAAIGALAVGAAAVGGFAIGRLSRRAAGDRARRDRQARISSLEVEELEIGRIRIREGWPAPRATNRRMRECRSSWAVTALATASLAPGARPRWRSPPRLRRPPPSAVGPYPSLGSCQVFPDPPASLPPPRPPCQRGRLEPGHLQGPARPALRRLHRLHRLPRRRPPAPRLRLAARLRLPLRGRRRRPAQAADPLHRLRRRERPRALPGPAERPGRGRQRQRRRPPRARRRPRRLQALRALPRLLRRQAASRTGTPTPGVDWDLRSTALRPDGWTSADAAGLPIFPGLVRYDEVAAGHLDHAIRVTFDSTRNAWIHPASHCAGDTSSPSAPPMGLRLRLKAGYGLGGFSGAGEDDRRRR